MTTLIICILLVSFAAICKALSDTLAWHYDWFLKRFPKLKSDFWKIAVTSKKVTKVFNYPVDAWHLSNSMQIICWLLLAALYKPYTYYWIEIPALGLWFVIVFNAFFNKLLQKKPFTGS